MDISNPFSPVLVDYKDGPYGATDVAVSGNYAYVSGQYDGGLRILDLANPAAPVEVGSYNTPGSAYGVAVSGNYAYVADRYHGLRVIDVSNPTAPVETGFYDTPGSAYGVAVSGNYAYVADYCYFGIYDISAATGISQTPILQPSSFSLSCYPNPFNSNTVIRYSLPRGSRVELEVFDVLGRVVSRMNLGNVSAGSYSQALDFGGRASGTYLVRLRTADHAVSTKIVLVR